MPELPEVAALASYVAEQVGGRRLERAELASFAALKTFDPPLESLVGLPLVAAGRRGKHLVLRFGEGEGPDARHLVVHLARGGWLQWKDPLPPGRPKPSPKSPLAVRLGFEGGAGFDVTEAGTEKRLQLHVVRDPADVERVASLGPDPLEVTEAQLGELLRAAGGSALKSVLTDQAVLAGVGNAYSDEVLHVARLSPFKPAGKLAADELHALHAALRGVLADAVARSAGTPAKGLKGEKREGMRVHAREGQPCPACGDVVRSVSYATRSFQYCATCQTGGKVLADRRLSRLLK